MRFLNKLRDVLSQDTEPVELEDLEDADGLFRQRRAEKLESIRKKINDFNEEVEEQLETLERDLEKLKGFEDFKNRAIIEDNIENFAEKRLNLIKDFSNTKDVEELSENLEQFLKEFNSMTDKRRKVLEEANVDNEVFDTLNDLNSVFEDIQDFIGGKYVSRERLEKLQSKGSTLEDLRSELDSLEQELNEGELERLEKQLEDKKTEIARLKDSSVRKEFEDRKEELEAARNGREEVLESIGKNMGRMERGLKKMLHESKIGKVSEEGSQALRDIRDGEKKNLLERDPEKVEEAAKAVENSVEGDFLSGSTRQRLIQGVSFFSTFSDKKANLNNLQERINELENKVENHSYRSDLQKLEKEREEFKRKLEQQKNQERNLEERRDSIQSEIEVLEEEITSIFEAEFDAEVINSDLE